MTAAETSRNLFELVAAGLKAGRGRKPRGSFFRRGIDPMRDGAKIGDAIDARVAQLRDNRWTGDYTNALTRGASTIVRILLQNGLAKEWPMIDADMTEMGWVDERVSGRK